MFVKDYRLTGLIGSVLLMLSEFLPWFSDSITLFDIYIIYTITNVEKAFIFLFPLIAGIITLIASLLIIKNLEYKINSVIIFFIGLGFLMLFIFDFIPGEILYLEKIGVGFYFCIIGFIIILIDVILILLSK
jgi:hypothetical protein